MQENTDRTDGKPETLRLTCDTMLGKLSRELRKLGVDTEYRRSGGGIRGYKQARAKGRVFLTRTNRLKELPDVFFVESNDPAAQLAQVREKYGLPAGGEETTAPVGPELVRPAPAPPRQQKLPAASGTQAPAVSPGSRCIECNVALEKISRDQARPSIPFFIYQIHHEFSRCPKCRRVFWPGSHTREAAPASPPTGRGEPGQTAANRPQNARRRGERNETADGRGRDRRPGPSGRDRRPAGRNGSEGRRPTARSRRGRDQNNDKPADSGKPASAT